MKVIDPVCNMEVEDKDAAGASEYKAKKILFLLG